MESNVAEDEDVLDDAEQAVDGRGAEADASISRASERPRTG